MSYCPGVLNIKEVLRTPIDYRLLITFVCSCLHIFGLEGKIKVWLLFQLLIPSCKALSLDPKDLDGMKYGT